MHEDLRPDNIQFYDNFHHSQELLIYADQKAVKASDGATGDHEPIVDGASFGIPHQLLHPEAKEVCFSFILVPINNFVKS